MRNVNDEQIIANFEELITEHQMQTASDLLIAAEPHDQIALIEQTDASLIGSFFEALADDERAEVTRQLGDGARQSLVRVFGGSTASPDAADTSELINEYLATRAAEQDAAARRPSTGGSGAHPTVVSDSPSRRDFAIALGRLVEAVPAEATVTVYTNPTAREQRVLMDTLDIDEHTLASALDPDESSRIEFESAQEAFIVWKRPRRNAGEHPELLEIASAGIFLRSDHLTVVSTDSAPLMRVGDKADSLQNLVLRLMAATVNEFLVELKSVKRTSQEIGTNLSRSLDNREFLRMFDLSEGLIYHINAIEGNGGVLRKLRTVAPRLDFDDQDVELLDDIVIDNAQCLRQGQIFSTVLAGLMDARGNLINNNMNVLLKNLTLINVVFLPLGVIAGMGGMSEFSMMLDHYAIDWRAGYAAFSVGLVVLGYVLLKVVRSWTNRMFGG